MMETVLTVPTGAVEDVLDYLMPMLPGGVREEPDPDAGVVRLRMRGRELPSLDHMTRASRRWPHEITEGEVSDDWRVRRLADYREDVIAGRLVVRPDWAPPPSTVQDIVLSGETAFGSGHHPTTRAILELLLDAEPLGSFADLGCGSAVLAILAARCGWGPLAGVDHIPESVESARVNARLNGVEARLWVADLSIVAPPPADGFAANIPAPVHAAVARSEQIKAAGWGVLSGFGPAEEAEVTDAYMEAGFRVVHRFDALGWSVVELTRVRDLPRDRDEGGAG